jgi:hypothetical protein
MRTPHRTRSLSLFTAVWIAFATAASLSQTPIRPPQLSPQAAYDQAITPFDITRRSKENWSDIEKAALTVAMDQAKDACLARISTTYTGNDLIAYARLCDLGQQWPIVHATAIAYISSKDEIKPQLDEAYAFEVKSDLNMQQWKAASSTSFAMLRAIPYGPVTDSVTTTTIRYLQFAYLADALDLLAQRQPYLLKLLRASQSTAAPAQTDTQPTAPAVQSIPLHTLFEHALDFAARQQYNNQPHWAAVALSDIESALPASLPPDEAIFIANARRRYAILGTHFPDLPGATPLLSPTALRHPTFGSVTVFLLFPPWCAQCLRQQHEMAAAISRHAGAAHMYGLLANDPPPPIPIKSTHPIAVPAKASGTTKSAADQLRGTPSLVVAPSTLADVNATDFPFLIATDHDGIIRLMVTNLPDNALVKDGPVDQIIDNILANWPPSSAL